MIKSTMRKFRSRRFKRYLAWFFVDSLILILSYIIAFYIRASFGGYKSLFTNPLFDVMAIGITLASLYTFGVYKRIWSQCSGDQITVILKGSIVATFLILGIELLFFDNRSLPISVVLVANAVAFVGFVVARYRSRLPKGLSWRWRAIWKQEFPYNPINVLIIGAGESGQNVAKRLKNRVRDNDRYQIVGFIDDDSQKHELYVEGYKILGGREVIPQVAEQFKVSLIIIAIHNHIAGQEFRDILNYCEETEARIKVAPDMVELVSQTNGVPLLRDLTAEDYLGRKTIGKHEDVDFAPITGKRVLVTGGAGSIGSELCRQIVADYAPSQLLLLDINESDIYDLIVDLRSQYQIEITPVLCDITRREHLEKVLAEHRPEVIFHAAAYKHVPMLEDYPHQAIHVNIGGTLNLAELAIEYQVERFVLISSDKAVEPSSVMGASKRICELLTLALAPQSTTLFTAVRFGNVLASRGSVVPIFQRQIDMGGPITITDKDMTRYFMSIREAVNLILHASCLTDGNDLFMLKMGEEIRILDLAKRMIRMRGLRPDHDIHIEFTGIRPGEKLQEELQNHFEASEETLHPDIVKLCTDHKSLHPSDFLEHIQHLISVGLDEQQRPIEQLNAIINMNYTQKLLKEEHSNGRH